MLVPHSVPVAFLLLLFKRVVTYKTGLAMTETSYEYINVHIQKTAETYIRSEKYYDSSISFQRHKCNHTDFLTRADPATVLCWYREFER